MSSHLAVSMDLQRIECWQEEFLNTSTSSASFHKSTDNEKHTQYENRSGAKIYPKFVHWAGIFSHSFSEHIVFYYLAVNGC